MRRKWSEKAIYGIGLMALTACTSDSELREEAQVPIGLSAYTAQPAPQPREGGGDATRADATLLAEKGIPDGQSIGVYAYYHAGSTWEADYSTGTVTPNFMNNQQATYDADDDALHYAPVKYWPNTPDDKLSFIAYYPYTDESTAATGITPTVGIDGLPQFGFTVNSDVTEQVDFLISELLKDQTKPTVSDRVRLLFRHATAKVTFRIVVNDTLRHDLATLKVNSLVLSKICTKGVYKATGPEWTYSTDETETDKTDKSDFTVVDNAAEPKVNHLTEPYLMLPQTLTDDVQLSIDYSLTFRGYDTTYKYDGNDGTTPVETDTYTYRNSATLQLNTMKQAGTATAIAQWEPHHHYVYTIRLGARQIGFTAQVVEWGDEIEMIIDQFETQ